MEEHRGSTPEPPPGHSSWECRGSGMLCSPNQTWRSGSLGAAPTCLWCFWKILGILEFCLENSVLLLRGAGLGMPGGNSGVGASGAVGMVWEGTRMGQILSPGMSQILSPGMPQILSPTLRLSLHNPAPCQDFWGGKTEFPQCWGSGGASFRLRRRQNSGWQKRQQLQSPG